MKTETITTKDAYIKRAREAAERVVDTCFHERLEACVAIAVATKRLEDFDPAFEILDEMASCHPNFRSEAFVILLEGLARAGFPSKAHDLIKEIDVLFHKVVGLSILGAVTKKLSTFILAKKDAWRLKDLRSEAFLSIVKGLIEAGYHEDARLLAETDEYWQEPFCRSEAFVAIGVATRERNDFIAAVQSIESLNDSSYFDALSNIAKGLAKIDYIPDAEELLSKLEGIPYCRALIAIGVARTEYECLDTAFFKILERARDPIDRLEGFAEIVEGFVRIGQPERAEEIAELVEKGIRSEVLASLVDALVATNRFSQAEEIAERVEDHHFRTIAFAAIAKEN